MFPTVLRNSEAARSVSADLVSTSGAVRIAASVFAMICAPCGVKISSSWVRHLPDADPMQHAQGQPFLSLYGPCAEPIGHVSGFSSAHGTTGHGCRP